MSLIIILALVICALSYPVWRIFQSYDATRREQDQRLFEIHKRERAVEIEREIRQKKQSVRAGEIARMARGVAKLHQEFPSYADSGAKYREYNRVMQEVREQKEEEAQKADEEIKALKEERSFLVNLTEEEAVALGVYAPDGLPEDAAGAAEPQRAATAERTSARPAPRASTATRLAPRTLTLPPPGAAAGETDLFDWYRK